MWELFGPVRIRCRNGVLIRIKKDPEHKALEEEEEEEAKTCRQWAGASTVLLCVPWDCQLQAVQLRSCREHSSDCRRGQESGPNDSWALCHGPERVRRVLSQFSM